MRQKNQVELNLGTGATGEARSAAAQETEPRAARTDIESRAAAGPSMEAIVERNNLRKALARVKANKGAAGIDGMTFEDLAPYLKEHWPTIRAQLLEGAYKPQPVRRVEIPKASGGTRPLGIPTVLDRFIQQAVMQVLQADWDGTFSETSFGFRPGRSAHQAVERAQAYIAAGHSLVVDIDLEKELEKRGHRVVRYADDCNIYVRSQRAGERVMVGIEKFLTKRLKLKVNKAKSAVAKPSVRKFLGFSFTGGNGPRRRIAPQAVARFKAKVRELTWRTRGRSLAQIVKELSAYLVGWRGYYGFCQTPSVLRTLDEWIRRRLRAIAWKQWKRGGTRYTKLRRRGVGRDLAAQTAGSPHGPWRLAASPALDIALPNAFFAALGVATLAPKSAA